MPDGNSSEVPVSVPLPASTVPVAPATSAQKKICGVVLVLMLMGLSVLCGIMLNKYGDILDKRYSVPWGGIAPFKLAIGPVLFINDQTKRELTYLGTIDDKIKEQLIALYPKEASGKLFDSRVAVAPAACGDSGSADAHCVDGETAYHSAVDRLAYESNADRFKTLASLMIVAAAFGALGSHVRSMSAFVNHVSNGDLDLSRWWPYYFVRPFYGMVFGVIVVTIIKAGFLTASQGDLDPSLGWISLAFFAGFGDREFAQKIRQISKALFGEAK